MLQDGKEDNARIKFSRQQERVKGDAEMSYGGMFDFGERQEEEGNNFENMGKSVMGRILPLLEQMQNDGLALINVWALKGVWLLRHLDTRGR
jgi:hypothetical protein